MTLVVVAVGAAPTASAQQPAIPESVGTIDGAPIAADSFARFVLAEQGSSGVGTEALDFLIQERLIELEARRRGVVVTELDIDSRIAALETQLRAQSKGRIGVEDQRVAMNVDIAIFRRVLRKAIAAERMMRDDFGLGDADVRPEKQSLWFQEQRARGGVRTEGLAAEIAAEFSIEFADERITRTEWGLRLFHALSKADADRMFDEFIGIELLLAAARKVGLDVTPQHVAREVQERTEQLLAKLKDAGMPTEGVDYLSTLKARGDDPTAVVGSDRFKAEILLKELARQRHGKDDWRGYYNDHRAEFDQAFGRRVRVATIFLRADPEKGGKSLRTWPEATAELDRIRQRTLAGDIPAAEAFSSFARQFSEHDSAKRGGDLGFLSEAQLEKLGLPAKLIDEKPATLFGPLTTAPGVHLLRIVEQRAASPFAEICGEVEKAARRALLQELRKTAKVERGI